MEETSENRIHVEKKVMIKHFIIIIGLSIIVIFTIPFVSSFFHKLGHFISARASSFLDARMIIYYPYGGTTTFEFSWALPVNDPRWTQLRIITIAGSLSECLSMGLINIFATLYKRIPFSVSFPLFASTIIMIINQIWYWVIGVTIPSNIYDSHNFITIPPNVNPIIVQYFSAVIGLFFIFFLILGLNFRIKKVKVKYVLPKERIFATFILYYPIVMFIIIFSFILNIKDLFYISIS